MLAPPLPAAGASAEELRGLLLSGAYSRAAALSVDAGVRSPEVLFDQGLAAFAAGQFDDAAAYFAQVAQAPDDPERALHAAVAASLALSKKGDRANVCEYTSIVEPLVEDGPLLWRGWIEEVRQSNDCG